MAGRFFGLRGRYVYIFSRRTFEVCKSVALSEARGAGGAEANNIALNLRINWCRATAHESTQILINAEKARERSLAGVDQVVGTCEAGRASAKGPHLPVAGTSSVSAFDEILEV